MPQLTTIPDLEQSPTFHEVCIAAKGLENSKAGGPVGLPAEIEIAETLIHPLPTSPLHH